MMWSGFERGGGGGGLYSISMTVDMITDREVINLSPL